jgi:hypothetical protein
VVEFQASEEVAVAAEPTSLLAAAAAVAVAAAAAGLQSPLPLLAHSDLLLRETLIFKGLPVRVVRLDPLL